MRKDKARGRSEKKKDIYPPEAQLVCDMLSGNTNPLVSITFLSPPDLLRGNIYYPRSMGFIVERFDNGLRLVATSKHMVRFFRMPAYKSILAFKNPTLTTLTCIGGAIEDPEPENDVAFVLVRDPLDAPTKPFVLHTDVLPITPGQTLYSAQNQCEPLQKTYAVPVTSQQVHDRNEVVFCKLSEKDVYRVPSDNLLEQQQLQAEGWIGYQSLQMISRPGYSGSPIWDNQLHLYGMDIRGSTPGDSSHSQRGDVTVCLPTHMLHAARQRVEALVKQRLAKA